MHQRKNNNKTGRVIALRKRKKKKLRKRYILPQHFIHSIIHNNAYIKISCIVIFSVAEYTIYFYLSYNTDRPLKYDVKDYNETV